MWIALLVLLSIPLIFIWSDQVIALFPQLQPYLPEKQAQKEFAAGPVVHLGPDGQPEEPGKWYKTMTDKGYVAWVVSADNTYRLAVGCRQGAVASLQVTQRSGKVLGDGLRLNFQFGSLALGAGAYAGSDLVGAVAQFSQVFLQTQKNEVLAQFDSAGTESGLIARELETQCVAPVAAL